MPTQQAPQDPASLWKPVPDDGNDTSAWKPVNDSPPPPSLWQTVEQGAENLGEGALKGLGSTTANIDDAVSKIPYIGTALTTPMVGNGTSQQARAQLHQASIPTNTTQKIGRGLEQAGEFLIPGLGEERAAGLAAEHLPQLGKVAAPLARMGEQALGAGAVNKAQGGDFKTGAMLGGAAGAVGEGMRAVAPHIAESALNIRKTDRAYGKGGGAIGRAALDETKGFTPGAVAESAQDRLNELNPQLNKMADDASVRPAPRVAGFLPAPAESIPLGEIPTPGKMPGALVDADRFPVQNVGEARVIRARNGQILPKVARNVEFPDESGKLPVGRNYKGQMLSRKPSRSAFMAGDGEPMFDSQGISGPGVLLRRSTDGLPLPEVPAFQPNTSASLSPARAILGRALDTAGRQGERTTVNQLAPMAKHLSETIAGEAIPEKVTARQLLDLNRGFGNEYVHRWNPETMTGVKGTAANVYHANSEEFKKAVPGARDLMRRQSLLIPVAKRAESAELNAPTAQRIAHRVAAHTGALAGAVGGGYAGYRHGGLGTALIGGTLGLFAPEILSSPTTLMMGARMANAPGAILSPLAGGALQLTRKNPDADGSYNNK